LSSGATSQTPAFVQQAADDGRLAALEDVDDAALGPALAVVAQDAHAHAVAVQHGAHLLRRQVDVGLAVVAADEAVAVAVALHDALDFAQQGGAGAWGLVIRFFLMIYPLFLKAQVAELVDALVSGTSA
jgi:hypothetical protein